MIPLIKDAFLNEETTLDALVDFLSSRPRLSMGSKCREFEGAFADWHERKDAVLFNSGGSANLALLQALKNIGWLSERCRVGFSALTWSTNVMPIIQLGMKPVAVDCEIERINVTSRTLQERLADTELDAMFLTNVLGLTGDIDVIRELCHEREILLIEDNCESLGSRLPAGLAGNFGIASTCSFFVAHHMSTIEGGVVVTDDLDLASMLRVVRANGWDRDLPADRQAILRQQNNVQSNMEAKYTFYDLGFNLRPTEITGFLGLHQLQYLDDAVETRAQTFWRLHGVMADNPDLVPPNGDYLERVSSFAIPVITRDSATREKYVHRFTAADVEIRPMIAGNIQSQPFYRRYVDEIFDVPGTDAIDARGFYCGNSPDLTPDEVRTIEQCLVP